MNLDLCYTNAINTELPSHLSPPPLSKYTAEGTRSFTGGSPEFEVRHIGVRVRITALVLFVPLDFFTRALSYKKSQRKQCC
ncbi:hypothetical protein HanXRQr2_Chr13g0582441 [Helianthus annuus]|uniref:Uncharacterized protein n=1 Tax=Helianthus annuus TaxID=4232 RepID=A0A9K3HB73_HELAN|nr:hypothetical protein HanXRQr2_Chr13g0582441 [Helianthus annuus]